MNNGFSVKDLMFSIGDLVSVKSDGFWPYSGMEGRVISVDRLGTPAHDTGNETDDIHIDFSSYEYSESQKAAFEQRFNQPFDSIAFDDVIMPPESLKRSLSNI